MLPAPTQEQVIQYVRDVLGADPSDYFTHKTYWAEFNLCDANAAETPDYGSGVFEKGTDAYEAFQKMCALITYNQSKVHRTNLGGYKHQMGYYKLGYPCGYPQRLRGHASRGSTGFVGIGGSESKWRYNNDSHWRILGKFAAGEKARQCPKDYKFAQYTGKFDPDARYQGSVIQAPRVDGSVYNTFSWASMVHFTAPIQDGGGRGKFNYMVLSPSGKIFFEEAAEEGVSPTNLEIIEWTHIIYDHLSQIKPFDSAFFNSVMPHEEGRYENIAKSIESLYLSAQPAGSHMVSQVRKPFMLKRDPADSNRFFKEESQRSPRFNLYGQIEAALGGDPRILQADIVTGQIGTKLYDTWDKYSSLFLSPDVSNVLLHKIKDKYDDKMHETRSFHFMPLSYYGKMSNVLADIDFLTFYNIHFAPYFLLKMEEEGYPLVPSGEDKNLSPDKISNVGLILDLQNPEATIVASALHTEIVNKYSQSLHKSARFSDQGLYDHTTYKIRDKIRFFSNYPTFVAELKRDWDQAYDEYAPVRGLMENLAINTNSIIGDNVVGGLLKQSIIEQVSRLVMNVPDPDFMSNQNAQEIPTLGGIPGSIRRLAEEERSIISAPTGNTNRSLTRDEFNNISTDDLILSMPIAEVKAVISPLNMNWVDCVNLGNLVEKFNEKTPKLVRHLMRENEEDNDPALFLKYLFPPKRFQALATVFATTALNEYSTMPTIMEVPKSNMGFLMNTVAMSPSERQALMFGMKQGDLYKGLFDNKSSDPRGIECFDLPFSGEFLDSFLGMLYEAIKEFPSLLFRGLASVMDPAYREMKLHYESCQIKNLTEDALGVFPARKSKFTDLMAGTFGAQGNKKYSGLISGASTDLSYGIAQLLALNPSQAGKTFVYLGEHLTSYMYKGPLSLLDGAFQFSIPCLGDNNPNINWPENSSFSSGRYGHPISPLTILALMTKELRGDKRLREMSGRCSFGAEQAVTYSTRDMDDLGECPNQEEAPFGDMPKPEDFEEEEE